ncbi:sugar-phosphate kinase [Virgibacillus dokdonensis]|uniref:Sugar-phosphate kinase n=1 Tax=Virgibacillus dokdonensis TaxID=302167 RepID=A0A3E0WGV8_9BACI|nr:class II D-tagatose-bisphosphate aldolase, non-catalytic subunit [Virgibacillus dokdonensis]RFA32192.1 sugar-phosphate kinase [Virgibacillus dokdonensis]
MKKIPIEHLVKGVIELRGKGDCITLLGIGPMSKLLLKASFELSKEKNFPLMFIASRNQVDSYDLGGGYVCNWNQRTFMSAIKKASKEVGHNGLYYVCRDHGGPWQRDKERSDHLEENVAMEIGKKSFREDLMEGFDLLHIDPTKDPYSFGKVTPMDIVLQRTIELINFCENERIKMNLPEVGYEVGTEETNGGLTSIHAFEQFINKLNYQLEVKQLPKPTFIVGQTGTLVRKTQNIGCFNYHNAHKLANIASKQWIGLKEHNCDYLPDNILLQHPHLGIIAANVAPEFGTAETRAYLELIKVENELFDHYEIKEKSNLEEILLEKAIKSKRWKKWMMNLDSQLDASDILKDKRLAYEILEISGHYTLNEEDVKTEIKKLFLNLKCKSIDGERFVLNRIKRAINPYVECFNLKDSSFRIIKQLKNSEIYN